MGNLEKTQRPLPITPLWEEKGTVRKRGSQNLCLPLALSQEDSPDAWILVCSCEHPTTQARGLPQQQR